MPWKPQVCPFCKKNYANKTGLRKHLSLYTGTIRLPADGVHELSKVKRLLGEGDSKHKYRCWTCSEIFDSSSEFREHVIFRGHCRLDAEDRLSTRATESSPRKKRNWDLPIDVELVIVKDIVFPFLHLPTEIRILVYKFLLGYREIFLGPGLAQQYKEPHRSGQWLQHNPRFNTLAIMSVSRQVYNEASQVLYSFNTFGFLSFKCLPVFLVGIGQKNAAHLRSVWLRDKWERARRDENVHMTEYIQSCVAQEGSKWNEEDISLYLLHNHPYLAESENRYLKDPNSWSKGKLVVRSDQVDLQSLSSMYRERYTMSVGLKGVNLNPQWGKAAYELCWKYRREENNP